MTRCFFSLYLSILQICGHLFLVYNGQFCQNFGGRHFWEIKTNFIFRLKSTISEKNVVLIFGQKYSIFMSRREMRSIFSRGPIIFTSVFSPEARCEAYPLGVQLFLLVFYPPKGDTQYLTRVQLILFPFIGVSKF